MVQYYKMLQGKEKRLMLIKSFILLLISISGGIVVSAGVFAFITMIGVFPRLASRTNTSNYIYHYETAIIAGGISGNIVSVFLPNISILGSIGLILFGFFSGIYVGCLSMALAENLKVMPILVRRINLKQGLPWLITALGIGRAVGSFYQFYMG